MLENIKRSFFKTKARKTAAVLLSAAMTVTMFPMTAMADSESSADTGWYNTTATEFTLTTADQLKGLAEIVNGTADSIEKDDFTGKTVKLGGNIDLSSGEWTPVGDASNAFAGTFDGQGKAVSGMSITSAENGYKGLFGNNTGTVKDFTISGSIGTAEANLTSGSDNIGGTVGYNNGTVSGVTGNVAIYVNSTNIYAVGGIVGQNGDTGIVTKCINNADINASKCVGGIVGRNYKTVSECVNTGDITGNGGGKDGVGGIIGLGGDKNKTYTNTVTSCYNRGDVSNSNGKWVGGIAGFVDGATTVTNCYDTGKASGFGQYNPIIGQSEGTITYNYCLDTTITTDEDGVYKYAGTKEGNEAKTETEMQSAAFVTLLNEKASESDMWKAGSSATNDGYPVLYWQEVTADEPGDTSVDTSWYNTTDKEFTLTTAAQLSGFAAIVNGTASGIEKDNFAGKTIKLGGDIAVDVDNNYTSAVGTFGAADYPMAGITYYTLNSDAKIWTPIGAASSEVTSNTGADATNAFAGTFDGQNHTVSGIYTDGTKTVQGLFGVVTGTVKNVKVSGCIKAKLVAGGIAADLRDGGCIMNCVNNAVVYADGGQAADSGLENGIARTGAIGGIVGNVGSATGTCTVVNNINNGAVTCTNTNRGGRSGGIIGLIDQAAYKVTIEKNINNADIHSYQYTGGIVGFNNSKVAPINACANNGNVFGYSPGSTYVGGIVGTCNSDITNCYNTGDFKITNSGKSAHNGGIVSDFAGTKLENCYNTGMCLKTGSSYGAICGTGYGNASNTKLANCYTLEGTVGEDVNFNCVTVKTEAELKALASDLGMYFAASEDGYPVLYFEAGDEIPVQAALVASSDSVDANGSITVELQLSAVEETSVASFEAEFTYDLSKVSAVSAVANSEFSKAEATVKGLNGATANKVSFMDYSGKIGAEPVTVATLTFTAGAEAGEAAFGLEKAVIGYSGNPADTDVDVLKGTAVNIKITDDVAVTENLPWAPEGYKLVTYTTAVKAAYTYDGNTMYYSEKFSEEGTSYVYMYLTNDAESAEAAKAKIAKAETGNAININYDGDVNVNKTVNIIDAQIASDLANGLYKSGFDPCTMLMRFAADVNGDKSVTTGDARAIQYFIHYGTFEVPAE